MKARVVAALVFGVAVCAGCSGATRDSSAPPPSLPPLVGEDLYSIERDGSGLRNLTNTSRTVEEPVTASPDGTHIAFIRVHLKDYLTNGRGTLVVANADGSSQRSLGHASWDPEYAVPPTWSPDGTRIAVAAGVHCGETDCERSELWVADVASGDLVLVARDAWNASWSPDGKRLAYGGDVVHIDSRDTDPGAHTIFVVGADGSGRQRLTAGEAAAWSPRGEVIAVQRDGDSYFVRPNGTGLRRFLRRSGLPEWSPDGSRLAFSTLDGLQVVGRDGRSVHRVGPSVLEFAWSPAGHELAWTYLPGTDRNDEGEQIFVAPADGSGTVHRVTHEPPRARIESLAWAGTDRIVFTAERLER
jgi:Tol biopolymer transport system component